MKQLHRLGIIGGGMMAEAILSRLLSAERYRPEQVCVSDPSQSRLSLLKERYQVQVTVDNQTAAQATEVLLLAVKPQVFEAVVAGLNVLQPQIVVISILAGVSLAKLEAAFGSHPVVRVMPNTPATVGAGMTAVCAGRHTQVQDVELAQHLFQAVGEVVTVPETLMNAVTGLSGSGPAFVAIAIEALADGGVAAGLPRAIAAQLALQTVRGTAELLAQTQLHPAELKDRVTSPGGTTIAGVAALEAAGFRAALMGAVQAACQRAQQIG